MFIGHFAMGLAAKKADPKINLGFLFIGCQLLDLIWPVLVLAGIETVSVDYSATQVTPFNFSHYPYSHSLVATLIYSLIGALIFSKLFKSIKSGIVFGLIIASHWLLDFITHRPDLPLLNDSYKVGLSLWNSLTGTLVIEILLFIIGVALYLQAVAFNAKKKKIIFWSMIVFLLLMYFGNIAGPKPPIEAPSGLIAGPALAMWLIVLWGYFADKKTA